MENNNVNQFQNNAKFQKFIQDKEKRKYSSLRKMQILEKFDNHLFRNIKLLTMGGIEFLNNVSLHIFDTIKVRLQAKSIISDISLFHANRVQEKSNYNI